MAKPAGGRARQCFPPPGLQGAIDRVLPGPAPAAEGEPNGLGGPAAQGDSPVGAPRSARRNASLSRAGHEEPGPNPGGPPSKPEYSPVTDSARVP